MDTNPTNKGAESARIALASVGAVVGGVAGWFLFFWATRQGFYALALPGAGIGIGGGYLVRGRSVPFAVVCGIAGVIVGTLAEWRFAPFIKDAGLGYFLGHLHELKPITLLFIALGGFISFWVPFRARPAE